MTRIRYRMLHALSGETALFVMPKYQWTPPEHLFNTGGWKYNPACYDDDGELLCKATVTKPYEDEQLGQLSILFVPIKETV